MDSQAETQIFLENLLCLGIQETQAFMNVAMLIVT